jgi:hypothetical protein
VTLTLHDIARVALIGVGATAVMDLWLALLRHFGIRSSSFALVGRWAGHVLRGRFAHADIARAESIAGELAWGWVVHYAIGIAFAALLVGVAGNTWMTRPTALPALAIGLVTVLAPLGVMQPAMGAGFFASRTLTPLKNCLRSIANHAVFGLGLYGSAVALVSLSRAF